MQSKSSQYQTLKLLTINIAFISLWLVTLLNPERLKALWFVVVLSLALLFIIKNKNTSKHDIFAGVALGCLVMPSHAVMGICSIVAYIGGASVLKTSKNKILLFKAANIKEIMKTVGIATIAGATLAVINILLARSAMEFNISIEPEWFLRAIKAGVSEEIIFRFFFSIYIIIYIILLYKYNIYWYIFLINYFLFSIRTCKYYNLSIFIFFIQKSHDIC